MDNGDDLPESSGEPRCECASNRPCAVIFEEPIAGATFDPSALPTCSRLEGFNETELAVETTLSVGLGGLSGVGDVAEAPDTEGAVEGSGEVTLRPLGLIVSDAEEPLIVASRLRRSSNGAPPLKV